MIKNDLRAFAEAIGGVGASSKMSFSAGLPGMGGSTGAMFGGANANQDVILKLHKTVNAFAGAYQNKTGHDILSQLAQDIEGQLFMLQTLSVITEEHCDELLTQLESLMAAKQ